MLLPTLVWTLVLAPFCTPNASLAQWQHLFCVTFNTSLSYSSFYDRLTPELTAFFGDVLDHFLAKYRPN